MSGSDTELDELYALAQTLGPAYVELVVRQAELERGARELVTRAAEHRRRVAEATAELSARLAVLEAQATAPLDGRAPGGEKR